MYGSVYISPELSPWSQSNNSITEISDSQVNYLDIVLHCKAHPVRNTTRAFPSFQTLFYITSNNI